MARSNVTGQLSALLSALEAQDLAQADAAAVRLAAALRRFPGGVQSISAAAFDELLRHLSSPVSERAYEVAARATCACLMAEGDDESRFAWQVCGAAGPAAALVRGIASHDAALRLRVLAALPCVFAVMLEALTEQEQHQFDTAIAKAPGVPAAVGRLLGGSDEHQRNLATGLLWKILHATPPTDSAAASEVARQPGALPGLIAAAGVDAFALVALSAWLRLVQLHVAPEDMTRGAAEAGARGALRRVAGAAGRLLASDDPADDKDFSLIVNGLTCLCQNELAAAEVAANAGVVGALRRALRSGARAEAGLRLLLKLQRCTGAPAVAPPRDGGEHRRGGGGGGGGAGSAESGGGGGSLGDPGLLAEVVRAAASADSNVCLLAFRFIGAGAGVWSVPLMAPVAVSALRKMDWELTTRASMMMCVPLTPATIATLLQLGAPDALRAAASVAAAFAAAADGAAKGASLSDVLKSLERDAAWVAAMWAAIAAIKLPLEAAASRTPGGLATPADPPPWALDLFSKALAGARGAARAAKALGVMAVSPVDVVSALARHPGLLRGVGAFVAACGDAAVVESGLKLVRKLTMLEAVECAGDATEGGGAGEPGGPDALAELRRWLSVLSRAPDRAVAWEGAAGLAAFDASRRASAGDCGSSRGRGEGGGGGVDKGAGAGRGATATSGGCSSDEAAGSAGASTSQQATAAPPPQRKGKPNRSCSVCGQTEAQLGRAPKACAGCRKVRYCGEECARAAWPAHKKECKEAQQTQQQQKQQAQPQQAQQVAEQQQQQQQQQQQK